MIESPAQLSIYDNFTLQAASQFCATMVSRGEIVEKVVRASGYTISGLASRLKISRTQLYDDFTNPDMPLDRIVAIGKILHHDFSEDFKDIPAGLIGTPALSAGQLQECQSKLLSVQEQLINAMTSLARYREKYGPEPI